MTTAHDHPGHRHAPTVDPSFARLLELDTELHLAAVEAALDAADRLADGSVTRVLDLGAGVGAGTLALARRLPGARVVAVDASPTMLAHVRERTAGLDADTVQADLGDEGLDLGTSDLVWVSNALHEVPDPAAALAGIHRSLRPGGLLVVLEMDGTSWVLPDSLEAEERALRLATGADHVAPEWSGPLEAAGFLLEDRLAVRVDRELPADGPGGEYAGLELARLGRRGLPELDPTTAETLRAVTEDLLAGWGLTGAVHVRGTRLVWVARRP